MIAISKLLQLLHIAIDCKTFNFLLPKYGRMANLFTR